MLKKLFLSLLTLGVIAGSAGYGVYNYAIGLGKERIVSHSYYEVHPGDSFTKVVNELVGTQNDYRIKLFSYLNPQFHNLKIATYDLANIQNLEQALELINSGKGVTSSIRLIPGRTWKDWKKYLSSLDDAKDNIKDKSDAEVAKLLGLTTIEGDKNNFSNLEGYFLPETYIINYHAPVSQALAVANKMLNDHLMEAWNSRNEQVKLASPYELLIMASIIEKEKGNNEEAPIIASVFYNRLAKNMRLQTDPTVIYGLGDKYDGDIKTRDLRTPTPYNTYTIDGLPPTPIAMVTKNSLMAAAHPAKTDYLYFVALYGQGKHTFSKTYAEHNEKVNDYKRDYYKANKK